MRESIPFGEILEAAESLSVDDQAMLISVLKNRLREHRRAEVIEDSHQAEREFAQDKCRPVSPDELMREILS